MLTGGSMSASIASALTADAGASDLHFGLEAQRPCDFRTLPAQRIDAPAGGVFRNRELRVPRAHDVTARVQVAQHRLAFGIGLREVR